MTVPIGSRGHQNFSRHDGAVRHGESAISRVSLLALAAIVSLASGAAWAQDPDVGRPMGSPQGTQACTNDPALINDVRAFDPACVEDAPTLKPRTEDALPAPDRDVPEPDAATVEPDPGTSDTAVPSVEP